jgi:hypothetical protein
MRNGIRQKSDTEELSMEVGSEDFTLCGVFTVTFRELSFLAVTKCYSRIENAIIYRNSAW